MEKEKKTQIIDEFKRHDGDTGSSDRCPLGSA